MSRTLQTVQNDPDRLSHTEGEAALGMSAFARFRQLLTGWPIKWGIPAFTFAFAFFFQSCCLHIATHFYVQWMYRLRHNLEHRNGVETTISGEKLSTDIEEGALHDQIANWVGYQDIPMEYLDAISASVPMIWLVLVVHRRDLHTWSKCCFCGAILAVCKGLLGVMTVVPDSTGWSHCKDRLGEHGIEFFKDPNNMNSQHMMDFVRDLFNLELAVLHKGSVKTPVRFCADMVYSGHTYMVTLFSLGFYDAFCQMTKLNACYPSSTMTCLRFAVALFLCCVVVADVTGIIMNRFHYSMDVFLALLITVLLYSNGAISSLVRWWTHLGQQDTKCSRCGCLMSIDVSGNRIPQQQVGGELDFPEYAAHDSVQCYDAEQQPLANTQDSTERGLLSTGCC